MRKHTSLCDLLAERLKHKKYVKNIEIEIEYDKGELDVNTEQTYGMLYYEIKCNHHPRAYEKAVRQLCRWSEWFYKQSGVNAYGVYWTPQTGARYVVKNGRIK